MVPPEIELNTLSVLEFDFFLFKVKKKRIQFTKSKWLLNDCVLDCVLDCV